MNRHVRLRESSAANYAFGLHQAPRRRVRREHVNTALIVVNLLIWFYAFASGAISLG